MQEDADIGRVADNCGKIEVVEDWVMEECGAVELLISRKDPKSWVDTWLTMEEELDERNLNPGGKPCFL